MRAFFAVIMPKFLANDQGLFYNILLEVFPLTETQDICDVGFKEAIRAACVELQLQATEDYMTKVLL